MDLGIILAVQALAMTLVLAWPVKEQGDRT